MANWYTIQTRSMYENKILEEIPKKLAAAGLTDKMEELFAPEEVVITYKDGVKKETKKKKYPNYIFIKVDYSEDVWYALKSISGFNGFLGNRNRPDTVSDREIEVMKKEQEVAPARLKVEYPVDSTVMIKNGSFKDFQAIVISVDYAKNTINLSINIFGRETPVEMPISDVEKI